MRIICCQPATQYYAWQVEVFLHQVRKYYSCQVDVVCAEWHEDFAKLEVLDANFFYYADTRACKHYPPSIYFHLMYKHLMTYPELQKEVIFMVDCDTIFTKKIDFDPFLQDDICYLSNTNSYINYTYLKSKGMMQLVTMCNIVGIDISEVKKNNLHSGGAQYLLKNLTPDIFAKAEADSVKLYDCLTAREKRWRGDEYPIQKWTAGMWAILWGLWLAGKETRVVPELDFIMATSSITELDKVSIYHNAGATQSDADCFKKSDYIYSTPYNLDLKLGNNASRWFYRVVQEVEKITVL